MSNKGWIGVDFDGTLVISPHYSGPGTSHPVGDPIPRMVDRVRKWLEQGEEVRIVTARAEGPWEGSSREVILGEIEDFCWKHFGRPLMITATKDWNMRVLYDDRAVHIVPNTGMTLDEYREETANKRSETEADTPSPVCNCSRSTNA